MIEVTIKPLKEVRITKNKTVKIKGNEIYAGMHYAVRSKVSKTLKTYIYEHIRKLDFITVPIRLEINVYKPLGKWDLGNYCYLWAKCFEDSLTGNVLYDDERKRFNHILYPPKIKDDNVNYIKEHRYIHHPIIGEEEERIVFVLQPIE